MPDTTPTDDENYRRSSFSDGGNCVEIAIGQEHVRVRHSRHDTQGTLVFSHGEWAAFVAGVKAEEFELPR
ncbi:DUF397 domain-containing protein [Pseudonocardia sp. GCM10023141]|uniref:DUF397 domain-containing protein n=1 Tax=Pseudonocardia sp. GCM10023141 TaxID=3252653 RepID=UPI00362303CA